MRMQYRTADCGMLLSGHAIETYSLHSTGCRTWIQPAVPLPPDGHARLRDEEAREQEPDGVEAAGDDGRQLHAGRDGHRHLACIDMRHRGACVQAVQSSWSRSQATRLAVASRPHATHVRARRMH